MKLDFEMKEAAAGFEMNELEPWGAASAGSLDFTLNRFTALSSLLWMKLPKTAEFEGVRPGAGWWYASLIIGLGAC